MNANRVLAAVWTLALVALLALVTVVWQEQTEAQDRREDAVLRVQSCVVEMLLVHPDNRQDMTVNDLDRLCPGIRESLEDNS